MAPPTVAQMLEASKNHASTHQPLPTFSEMGPNTPHTIIISCADPRVHPETIFSLSPGDGIVFRTIAGHPHPVLPGILALDVAIGINDIILVHHTDCGSTYFTEEGVRQGLEERCSRDVLGEADVGGMVFGAVTGMSIEDNLREDLKWIRSRKVVRQELREKVRGFLFDIKTGELREVQAS